MSEYSDLYFPNFLERVTNGNMHLTKIPSITSLSPLLRVKDIDSAIEYYTSVLGFTLDFRYEDFYAGVSRDGFSIHLKVGRMRQRQVSETDDIDMTFAVDDVAVLYEELTNNHATIVQPLREMPYGKEFYVADADGNVLSFLETIQKITLLFIPK
jgi:predicted enzyme related to lactoylglutathione lyase